VNGFLISRILVCAAGVAPRGAFAAGADISEFASGRANAAQAKSYGQIVANTIELSWIATTPA